MARSTQARASDSPRDAITLLKQDHRTVESLLREFENADESEQSALAERICQLLTVHAQIEEEILYPAATEAMEDEESELVSEAHVEHNAAKELIAKIEGMDSGDERFQATVKVLGEYVKHHVKEEETQLFPKMRKAEVDLKELGGRLADRKFALMEQMGIKADEQAAPPRKTGTRAPRRAAASRPRQGRSGRSASRGTSRTTRH